MLSIGRVTLLLNIGSNFSFTKFRKSHFLLLSTGRITFFYNHRKSQFLSLNIGRVFHLCHIICISKTCRRNSTSPLIISNYALDTRANLNCQFSRKPLASFIEFFPKGTAKSIFSPSITVPKLPVY